jgi:hypothetical protein
MNRRGSPIVPQQRLEAFFRCSRRDTSRDRSLYATGRPDEAWQTRSRHHRRRRFQGAGFHEQALPFVTLAGAAKADHDCGQPARSMCLPGAFGVTGWKEDEVVKLGAAQAMRLIVLLEEQVVAGRGAGGARPLVQRRDDDQAGGWFMAARIRSAFAAERSGDTQCVR